MAGRLFSILAVALAVVADTLCESDLKFDPASASNPDPP